MLNFSRRGMEGLLMVMILAASCVAAGGDGTATPANETADDLAAQLPVTRPRVIIASSEAKRLRGEAVNEAMGGDCAQAIMAFRQFVDTDDFNNYAVCLQQEGRREEALEEFEEGIKRFYHSEKLHQNLGLLLEELATEDFLQGRGAGGADAAAVGNRATTHLNFAMRLQLARLWEKHSATVPKQDRIGLGRKTVAIFCRPRNLEGLSEGVWGPSLVLQDAKGDAVILMLFLLPGRHAGPDGDVATIAKEHAPSGLRWKLSPLLGTHYSLPSLIEVRFDHTKYVKPASIIVSIVLLLCFLLPPILSPFLPKTIAGLPRFVVVPCTIVAALMVYAFAYFRAKHRKKS